MIASRVFESRETTLEEVEELQIGPRFLHAPHQVKPSSPRRQPLLDTGSLMIAVNGTCYRNGKPGAAASAAVIALGSVHSGGSFADEPARRIDSINQSASGGIADSSRGEEATRHGSSRCQDGLGVSCW